MRLSMTAGYGLESKVRNGATRLGPVAHVALEQDAATGR